MSDSDEIKRVPLKPMPYDSAIHEFQRTAADVAKNRIQRTSPDSYGIFYDPETKGLKVYHPQASNEIPSPTTSNKRPQQIPTYPATEARWMGNPNDAIAIFSGSGGVRRTGGIPELNDAILGLFPSQTDQLHTVAVGIDTEDPSIGAPFLRLLFDTGSSLIWTFSENTLQMDSQIVFQRPNACHYTSDATSLPITTAVYRYHNGLQIVPQLHQGPMYLVGNPKSTAQNEYQVHRVDNMIFGTAIQASAGFTRWNFDGILGMGLIPPTDISVFCNQIFIQQLSAQRKISAARFTVALKSKEFDSYLILGPHKAIPDEVWSNWVNTVDGCSSWAIQWDAMIIMDHNMNTIGYLPSQGQMPFLVDTGCSTTFLPCEIRKALESALSAEKDAFSGKLFCSLQNPNLKSWKMQCSFGNCVLTIPLFHFVDLHRVGPKADTVWCNFSDGLSSGQVYVNQEIKQTYVLGNGVMRNLLVEFEYLSNPYHYGRIRFAQRPH
ncbi:hypothetical protein MIND_00786400 [Mycena indigotica]|uniref:Peptidase A1 domain-containing protein n=1 Tax=Mycena indigotica TaxID=2126181 RepID=A0A8H6SLY5_9AGAR|nr:uncharacterized protein MIND_00786400 [Mycena indigotica]KAF7302195.1 hypothetical protein MIND_00786400 [Mycena indigotica]